eukprot:11613828-Alexandrium_andersonii.AAC.1
MRLPTSSMALAASSVLIRGSDAAVWGVLQVCGTEAPLALGKSWHGTLGGPSPDGASGRAAGCRCGCPGCWRG